MSRITEVEIVEFAFTAKNLGQSAADAQAVYNIGYKPNASLELTKFAIAIRTDDGAAGEYVVQWGGTRATMAQTLSLAPNLLGRDPDQRELLASPLLNSRALSREPERDRKGADGGLGQMAAVAICQACIASARKIRSVRWETRWR